MIINIKKRKEELLMSKVKNRIISMFLAFVMIFAYLPLSVFAETYATSEDCYYTYPSGHDLAGLRIAKSFNDIDNVYDQAKRKINEFREFIRYYFIRLHLRPY
jgi:hypothetical protein